MSELVCKSPADTAAVNALEIYRAATKRAHFRPISCVGVYPIRVYGPESNVPKQFGPQAYREAFVVVIKEEFCNHYMYIDRTLYTVFVDGKQKYSVTNPNGNFAMDLRNHSLAQTKESSLKYLSTHVTGVELV